MGTAFKTHEVLATLSDVEAVSLGLALTKHALVRVDPAGENIETLRRVVEIVERYLVTPSARDELAG